MNRILIMLQLKKFYQKEQDFGFENLSIDLIYGSPTSILKFGKKSSENHKLQVPHVSSYALTIET